MDVSSAVVRARQIAATVLSPSAADNDKQGRFSTDAVCSLGENGLLGLVLPASCGGAGLGARAFADVTATLAEADPSVAMVFMMHTLAAAVVASAPETPALRRVLEEMANGSHLSTLAFSEAGSRSHFWAPVSRAESLNGSGVRITARKSFVTSAGHANSLVVSTLAPTAAGPTDSTLYLVPSASAGVEVSGSWDGMGLRGNASAPVSLQGCRVMPDMQLTAAGAGFAAMLEIVLPLFNLGSSAVSLGICRATVASTTAHLKSARFEHLGASLGESLPNLRAQLATMQVETDGLAARIADTVAHLEQPGPLTVLRVLEAKAAAGETAIAVTSLGMRTCGGAAFARHTGIDRYFRDAHACAVMAPTTDVLREFIGRALLGMPLF
jgi:alkylation response protein AidB-like acyl-CoA dehydrogenase